MDGKESERERRRWAEAERKNRCRKVTEIQGDMEGWRVGRMESGSGEIHIDEENEGGGEEEFCEK